MMFRLARVLAIASILTAVVLLRSVPAQNSPQVQTQGEVKYVTGGVGTEERSALEAMSSQFNLKITLALKTGHFVGDATVRIADAEGHTVLDTKTDGPLLYAHLAPGTYRVTVTRNGKDIQETAHVTESGQASLEFTWSEG